MTSLIYITLFQMVQVISPLDLDLAAGTSYLIFESRQLVAGKKR